MMSNFVSILVKAFCLIVSAAFIFTIAVSQLLCSKIPAMGHQCQGPDGDVWMAPLLLSPIGIPASIASIVILVRATRK